MPLVENNEVGVNIFFGIAKQSEDVDLLGTFHFNSAILVELPEERTEGEINGGAQEYRFVRSLDRQADEEFYSVLSRLGSQEAARVLVEFAAGSIRLGNEWTRSIEMDEEEFSTIRVNLTENSVIRISSVSEYDWQQKSKTTSSSIKNKA